MLRDSWSQQDRTIITKLISMNLTKTPIEHFRKSDTFLSILSQLMGNELFYSKNQSILFIKNFLSKRSEISKIIQNLIVNNDYLSNLNIAYSY